MFGAIVRATVVLVAGSMIALTVSMAGGPLVDVHQDHSPPDSNTAHWSDVWVTWFPAMIIAAVVLILIGNAILRRRQVT